MEGFTGRQIYPNSNQTYMQRVQALIDAYYENDTGMNDISASTAADDVERLSNQLTAFPRCINEHVDKLLVEELSVGLPEDDIEDLTRKHETKCTALIEEARKSIIAIEKYSAAMGIPHLFTKEETDDLSDDSVLRLIVRVVIDMYGEKQISPEEYIRNLKDSRQKLDNTLLSLDYD